MDNLIQLENDILEINGEIQKQNEILLTANQNLSSIKTSLSESRLPDKLFKKLLEAREVYIKDKNNALSIKRKLALNRQKKAIELESLKRLNEPILNVDLKNTLLSLKDKYFEFYKDKTRIAPMRKMASDFIIDLDKIIKKI